ncbi:MAG: helix-turn-helix domain-containing protein [Acidimicrobiia bacterium]
MSSYNEKVGAMLRSIRKQRGLSLQDVQRLSEGEFKAAVVGAYERGERSLSMPRLHRLSRFFQVPISQFLPQEEEGERTMEPLPSGGVTIDLNRLERMSGTDAVIFNRFLRSIQMMRQDFNGKVLTIRRDDLRLLGLLIDQSEEAFSDRLAELGLTTGI